MRNTTQGLTADRRTYCRQTDLLPSDAAGAAPPELELAGRGDLADKELGGGVAAVTCGEAQRLDEGREGEEDEKEAHLPMRWCT